ncbi:hypothetical protein [Geodermatophilus nigrescens]|uniref:ATP-binding protein n=1 Tax=Geodermatophilus nigrescens TaxID=1070870 RepID=A0A1M5MAJ0_9ACTN|nr:hypothetical protein [Geodermatophilus nigrescens]SHG73919.1 hypothetical protein SAMN05444351_3087 [Geodermatophilus nigrescens]
MSPTKTAQSSVLADQLRPRQSYLRATNIEQHTDLQIDYIPTGRALDVLNRITRALGQPVSGRAWSLTGPYGAGKSSFALYLHTILGPASPLRDDVDQVLGAADPTLMRALQDQRSGAGASTSGFVRVATTCQSEPVSASLLRALHRGVTDHWPREVPGPVEQALAEASRMPTARSLTAVVDAIAEHAPVLILLDEFGKAVEHFAASTTRGPAADLFVLQELAEHTARSSAHPIVLLTLQHLAFDDYMRGVSLAQRREWGKVAGRFEDVPFLETTEQSFRLIAGALDDSSASEGFSARRSQWGQLAERRLRELGLASRLPGGAETLQRCYPLHPVALLALPGLCAQLGQHGRTLFTFLSGAEPHSVAEFLATTAMPEGGEPLPTVDLPRLFDFFAGPGQSLAASTPRWLEIDVRIREAAGLPPEDLACLKAVGLLNLLGQAGGLRASADLIAYALSSADSSPQQQWRTRLADLETRGWLTYRGFADEYRLWQGSDVDLRGRVADAREQLRSLGAAELLTRLHSTGPVIAGKHSQRVGMLRYFTPSYADSTTGHLIALGPRDPADGALVYFLDDPERLSALTATADGRPILAVTTSAAEQVRDAAIEAAAALAVLDQQDVHADRVARRELQDRAAGARRRLTASLEEAFRPGAAGVQWRLLGAEGPSAPLPAEHGLSRLLSDVCEQAYGHSPEVRNEMLGRRELTSQGAKARRNLLEAMVTSSTKERLGLQGYGPERAMYEALLHHTQLHRAGDDGEWSFGPPKSTAGSSWAPAWGILTILINKATSEPVAVDTLYARLMAPPIGLKEGPIPVLLAALLLHRSEDVAIYQDGTYQPSLTIDLLERLIKTPGRFSLKTFNLVGTRSAVLAAVADAVPGAVPAVRTRGRGARNTTVLAAAAPLLNVARELPDYTRYTTLLSPSAVTVRTALFSAREPDELLFSALPAACGLEPFSPETRHRTDDVTAFGERLGSALKELQAAYDQLLVANATALAAELRLPSAQLGDVALLREELRTRTAFLRGKALEQRLRTFAFTALDEHLDDRSWLEALSLAIGERPPAAWRDEDRERYASNLRGLVTVFRRVQALHFDADPRSAGDGFAARRLVLTTPDGSEASRVMYVDDTTRTQLQQLAQDVLDRAVAHAGEQGREGLLTLLAELVLGGSSDARNVATEPALPHPQRIDNG